MPDRSLCAYRLTLQCWPSGVLSPLLQYPLRRPFTQPNRHLQLKLTLVPSDTPGAAVDCWWREWLLSVSGDDFCQPPGQPGVGAGPRPPRAAWIHLERAAARGSAPRTEAQLSPGAGPSSCLGGGRIPLRPFAAKAQSHGFSAKAKVWRKPLAARRFRSPQPIPA